MPSQHHDHHTHQHASDQEHEEVEFESYLQMERTLRHIYRLTGKQDFPDADSAAAYLETLSEADLKRAAADLAKDPKGMAQEFAYEALEAEDDGEALSFAEQALKLDPNCVDALHVIAECNSETREEMIALLEKAVKAGDREAAGVTARPKRSPFWDMVELSPCMRAHSRIGDLLRLTGKTQEAIGHFESMLKLDPDDNHGARDLLLACYLQEGELAKARELLVRFAEDQSAPILWAATLERFLANDPQGAANALAIAREQNRYVAEYLAFRKSPEGDPPGEYEPGDENEALHCVYSVGMAWMKYPAASEWLSGQIA